MSTVNEKLTAIADAIRFYTGGADPITLDEMVEGIHSGNEATKEHYFLEGTEQGKQAEYDAFWDAYQNYGNRTAYDYAFPEGTSAWIFGKSYKPKYAIKPKTAMNMYYASRLKWEAHEAYPVDFSQCTDFYNCFAYSAIDRLGVVDMSKATRTANAFANCNSLHTIDKMIASENTAFHNATFSTTPKLANITFEGVIGKSISFADSHLLTTASVQSIIDHLKDLTGATTQTLTVHQDVRNRMTPEQVDTIVNVKNWTLAPAASTS